MAGRTRRFDGAAAGKGTDTLQKLDSLTDLLGGLKARAMLVSYRPLSLHDRQRAKDLRIEVCQGVELKQLQARLKKWVDPTA